jgi:uncharacterized protein YkwD
MRARVLAALAAGLALAGSAGAAADLRPRAKITDGPTGVTEQTAATFRFEATAPTALSSFECRLDAGAWTGCSSPYDVKDLGGGPHSFEVRLTGTLADGTPDRRDWTVQQQTVIAPPPLPEPTAPPPPLPPRPNPTKPRESQGCRYAANEPGEVRAALLRKAALCLIARERAKRGLRPVRRVPALERAAAMQVRDMLRRRYFGHVSPTGRDVGGRAAAVGYLRGARSWTVGEVLAWLIRPRPTPKSIVRAWMKSPGHRAVLLGPSFRDAGIAMAAGNPRTRGGGATWAAVFGRVSRG